MLEKVVVIRGQKTTRTLHGKGSGQISAHSKVTGMSAPMSRFDR